MLGHLVKTDSLDNQEVQDPRVLLEIQVVKGRPVPLDNRAHLEIRALLGQQDQLEILVPLVLPVLEVRPDREELQVHLEVLDLLDRRDCRGHQGLRDPSVRQVQ